MSNYKISLKTFKAPKDESIEKLIQRPVLKQSDLDDIINNVFDNVRSHGDQAIIDFTKEYDGVAISNLSLSEDVKSTSSRKIDKGLREAIDTAYDNIHTFHKAQIQEFRKITTSYGVTCWQENRAIEKVGLYIPGGTAPLFSTVLMLGIPAQIAGCDSIVLCTPPDKEGLIHPAILYAAEKCGITKVFCAGGAQAIAGMVLGTQSIPKVYKIFGPGNQYVTAAKMRGLRSGVAIDLPAGPSELLVYADRSADPSYVAADLLSQAEHGSDSQVVLVTTHAALIEKVNDEINRQLDYLSRADIASSALKNAFACVFDNISDSYEFINRYAPEHLILASDNAEDHLPLISNAGSVFIGHYTPESAGDYASGTNHTLPTAAHARAYSGVSLDSFIKKITFQKISKEGLENLGPTIITMAEHEELTAHANAVQLRLNNI